MDCQRFCQVVAPGIRSLQSEEARILYLLALIVLGAERGDAWLRDESAFVQDKWQAPDGYLTLAKFAEAVAPVRFPGVDSPHRAHYGEPLTGARLRLLQKERFKPGGWVSMCPALPGARPTLRARHPRVADAGGRARAGRRGGP